MSPHIPAETRPAILVEDASSAFLAFRYDEAERLLEIASSNLDGITDPATLATVFERVMVLLRGFEETHQRFIERVGNCGGFIITPHKVLKVCERLVHHYAAANPGGVADFAAAYVSYLKRELDPAIELLRRNQEAMAGDKAFQQLLATCCMLADRAEEARMAIDRALVLDATDPESQRLSKRIRIQERHRGQTPLLSGRWMTNMVEPDALLDVCRRYVLADFNTRPKWIAPGACIATIGSCFANNIANALVEQGIDAAPFAIAEEINNTYTNVTIFRMMRMLREGGNLTAAEGGSITADGLLNEAFVASIGRFAERLAAADVLIFTLGVSQGFFDGAGLPVLLKNTGGIDRSVLSVAQPRFIEVEENVANIQEIVRVARAINPGIKIVLTLSPVPMARTFGMKSAVVADAISKSTLRVAAHKVISSADGTIQYWPSFEMAKWIAPHVAAHDGQGLQFGADDNNSRHVSRKTVAIIMQLFLEYFS